MRTRLTLIAAAIAASAPLASACPTCSVGQGIETLAIVVAFLLVPYVVVSGVYFWMRRVLNQERGA